mmetsp:Transcript_96374/g.152401  ORF Transcript_96374/g.152401 Transcript_96374/m.152401 type:complete len:310 (-) Transcript_96374:184-1113(-)
MRFAKRSHVNFLNLESVERAMRVPLPMVLLSYMADQICIRLNYVWPLSEDAHVEMVRTANMRMERKSCGVTQTSLMLFPSALVFRYKASIRVNRCQRHSAYRKIPMTSILRLASVMPHQAQISMPHPIAANSQTGSSVCCQVMVASTVILATMTQHRCKQQAIMSAMLKTSRTTLRRKKYLSMVQDFVNFTRAASAKKDRLANSHTRRRRCSPVQFYSARVCAMHLRKASARMVAVASTHMELTSSVQHQHSRGSLLHCQQNQLHSNARQGSAKQVRLMANASSRANNEPAKSLINRNIGLGMQCLRSS